MQKNYIIIHHSATEDGRTFSWGVIRKYHMEEPNHLWRDVGYHFGVERVGDYVEVLFGRMPDDKGAHCPNAMMNSRGIGICIVGNYDQTPPPPDILKKALELCRWLMQRYDIPVANVLGHREVQELDGLPPEKRKSCPGRLFDMEIFRRLLCATER